MNEAWWWLSRQIYAFRKAKKKYLFDFSLERHTKIHKKTRKSFDRWAQEIKQGKWQVSSMEQKDLFWHQSTLVSYFGGGTSQELFNREVFHPHYGHRQYKSWFFCYTPICKWNLIFQKKMEKGKLYRFPRTDKGKYLHWKQCFHSLLKVVCCVLWRERETYSDSM